jgi:hypothetical protein
MKNAVTLLNVIGWGLLISSWVIPFVMKQYSEYNASRYKVGMILSVIALIFFVIGLVVNVMR